MRPDSSTPGSNNHVPRSTHEDGELRALTEHGIEGGAVTASYTLNPVEVVEMLNVALATEVVCFLRYRRHYFLARGIHSESVKAEFKTHGAEELAHADMLATRILQLGGTPDFSPSGLSKGQSGYGAATDLRGMIAENLVAERVAIESYRGLILFVGNADSTTRRMLEEILAKEEEHADDLAGLLGNVDPR